MALITSKVFLLLSFNSTFLIFKQSVFLLVSSVLSSFSKPYHYHSLIWPHYLFLFLPTQVEVKFSSRALLFFFSQSFLLISLPELTSRPLFSACDFPKLRKNYLYWKLLGFLLLKKNETLPIFPFKLKKMLIISLKFC